MSKDNYLIVGQGVAGSFLAWELLRQKMNVTIIDNNHRGSSSIISAGIISPITGKRLAIMENFDHFFLHAHNTYQELEALFQHPFFTPKLILRIFKNEEEKGKWSRKDILDLTERYSAPFNSKKKYTDLLTDPLGSFCVAPSGYCDTAGVLNAFKNHFVSLKILVQEKLSYDDIKIDGEYAQWRSQRFNKILFCEGYQAQLNPWFNDLPFNSVKGEILRIRMKSDNLPDMILNKGKWCAPLGNNV